MQKSIPSQFPINNQQPSHFMYTQSNPPPKQKIIASKDHAIQQLIIQNTYLKRQLSQLMLKTSVPQTPIQSAVQSPRQSLRPNMGQFYNNSLRNSIQKTHTANNFHNNTSNSHNTTNNFNKYSTNVSFNQHNKHMMQSPPPQNYVPSSKHGRFYRHSVDMCSNIQQTYSYVPFQQKQVVTMNQPQNIKLQRNNTSQSFQPKINNNTIIVPQVRIQPLHTQKENIIQQDQQAQCQMYRQKMMKLKGKKSPRSRQISEEKSYQVPKPSITIVNKVENVKNNDLQIDHRKQQLMKAHETLKMKLNSHDDNEQNAKILSRNELLQLQKQRRVQIQQKTPIKKLISTEDIKLINEVKKLPKYIPKTFSKQKQKSKQLLTSQQEKRQKIVVSNKTIELRQQQMVTMKQKTQGKQVLKQKKIGLHQLKGRVYLDDDQDQRVKTKRTMSKNVNLNINKKNIEQPQQVIENNSNDNNKYQRKQPQFISNKVDKVQMQKNNTKRDNKKSLSTDQSKSNIQRILMRKNSHKVYLQEDSNTNINDNPLKTLPKNIIPKDNNNKKTKDIVKQRSSEIVSIEEIHMIGDEDNNNQIVTQQSDTKDKYAKLHKEQQKVTPKPYLNSAALKSPSNTAQRKQLYNHIYCSQQSKTKFK